MVTIMVVLLALSLLGLITTMATLGGELYIFLPLAIFIIVSSGAILFSKVELKLAVQYIKLCLLKLKWAVPDLKSKLRLFKWAVELIKLSMPPISINISSDAQLSPPSFGIFKSVC